MFSGWARRNMMSRRLFESFGHLTSKFYCSIYDRERKATICMPMMRAIDLPDPHDVPRRVVAPSCRCDTLWQVFSTRQIIK